MTVSLVSYSVASDTSGTTNTTITGTLPAGGANGNLLVAVCVSGDSLNPSSVTLPADWTPIADNYNTNGNFNCHVSLSWKIRTGSESLTWTIDGHGNDDKLTITEWVGFNPADPVSAVSAISSSTTAQTFTSPSQTTTVDGSVVLAGCATKNGAAASDDVVPSGMTLIENSRTRANSAAVRSAVAYQVYATAGSSGTKEWTSFVSSNYYGTPFSVVINAANSPEITAVNEDDTVSDASSGNTVTTSLGLDSVSAIIIRDADLNETAGSSIAGSGTSWTFSTPAIADRSAAYYGSATLVLTGVYDSGPVELEFPITFNQPSGLDLTTLAAAPNTTSQAVGYGIITIAEGGQYAVDPAKAVVFTDALGYTIGDQSAQIAYVYDGQMTVFTLLTGSEASAGGFTAQGFTSQGFTAQGFTSRGFA